MKTIARNPSRLGLSARCATAQNPSARHRITLFATLKKLVLSVDLIQQFYIKPICLLSQRLNNLAIRTDCFLVNQSRL